MGVDCPLTLFVGQPLLQLEESFPSGDSGRSCLCKRGSLVSTYWILQWEWACVRPAASARMSIQRAPNPQPICTAPFDLCVCVISAYSNTPKSVASHRGNNSDIGTNAFKFVPSRWASLPFDLLKLGCANSVVGLELAESPVALGGGGGSQADIYQSLSWCRN